MNAARKYSIAWKGLSEGEHTFDFEAGDDLFRLFENTEIKGGHCDVKVNLLRAARQLRLEISIRGSVVVECDRCLGDCSVPIDYEGELLVKFSDEVREYDGDTLWLSPSEDFVPSSSGRKTRSHEAKKLLQSQSPYIVFSCCMSSVALSLGVAAPSLGYC